MAVTRKGAEAVFKRQGVVDTTNGKTNAEKQPKQADVLIALADTAGLFHDPDGCCYADIHINGHRETWPIRSRGFRRWLLRRFFEKTKGAPNSDAMQAALGVIEARAHYDNPERPIHLRVGECEGKFYLDLCNNRWQAIEITNSGWEVVDEPPVRFRRADGMQALPVPDPNGSIDELRRFLNVKKKGDDDGEFVLAVSWVLAGLRSRGPYPVLAPFGEQGSGKSTFCKTLRRLIDPNKALLRTLPRDERDLCISAQNGWIIGTDNVSSLPPWLSDAYCRLATGGGMATRQLYSDQDEIIFDAQRPIILNGIPEFVTRPDLADRSIFLALEPIPKEECRSDDDLWADFKAAHPRILGALLDAVAHGLDWLPHANRDDLPRMADFAVWARACEGAFWKEGTFDKAYTGNRDEAIDSVLEADLVATALRAFIAERESWEGTSSELLSHLSEAAGEPANKAKDWPPNPRTLSGDLRRAATALRKIGIDVAFARSAGGKRTRKISITRVDEAAPVKKGETPSLPSLPSQTLTSQCVSAGRRRDGRDAEANSSSRRNPLKNNDSGRWDGRDAKSATFTAEPPDPDAWSYQYDDYPELPADLDRSKRGQTQ